MLSSDESQQIAELRQVFLKTLPKRLETVLRRARRLLLQGWDVNALTVFFQDLQAAAGACGRYGVLDAGEVLFGLESFVAPFVERLEIPDESQRSAFQRHIDALAALIDRYVPEKAVANPSPSALSRIVEQSDFQTLVIPPREYWRRWDGLRHESAMPPAAPEPVGSATQDQGVPRPAMTQEGAVAPTARAQPKPIRAPIAQRIYHLRDGGALGNEIDRKLESLNYPCDVIEDAETLREMLGAFAPAMVIVDAGFLPQLEAIGDWLRATRERSNARVALVVLAESNDIGTRLKAMRAGADAFITLPATAAEAFARIEELLAGESSEPFRILIVEDDRSQAMFVESVLRKAGMETRVVMDPIAALEELSAFRPELILMDLYMPNCDGMELTTLIREREAYTHVPIVFLSGEQDEEKRFDALSAGGDDYLAKPIRPKHLISAVTNRVRRARALQKRVLAKNPRDPVTGLYDRAHLLDRLAERLAREDTHELGGGLMFLLVDGAQAIRERIGLTAFEQLLTQAGAFLGSLVESRDLCARYGDTSFIVLVSESDESGLLASANAIRQAFDQRVFEVGDRSITLAVSIGVSTFSQNLGEAAAMIHAAERACVAARRDPQSRVELYQTPVTEVSDSEEELVTAAIRDAIRNDEFQLLFQPIASLRGGNEEQFQALLRLRGDGGRTYTASVIVPLAERAGLIHGVDRWVLSRALLVISERARDGHPVRLFVSQSIDSLNDPQRLGWLKQNIEARRVQPDHLVIEFKTADAVARIRPLITFHQNARRLGIKLCLSNFEGTLANFQLLQHIQVDFVKVAAKYTSADGQNARTRAELRQAITRLRERGIRVVAPQVEDAKTATSLWSTGVDFIQGNFVQPATPSLDFDFSAMAL